MKKKLIYADHAATTRLSEIAFASMLPFLKENFGNPSSLHAWAKRPRRAVAEARQIVAECINAKPEQIFFTSGGTESDNWVIKVYGVKHVITTEFEHHAVLNSCESVSKKGSHVEYVPIERDGCYKVEKILGLMHKEIKGVVSAILANNEIGTVQDVSKISSMKKNDGWLVHTDAVQAMGNIPIDVCSLGVDFLSASAHKFNGPRGAGILYVREPKKLEPFISGGQQEFGMRAGTENVAAIVGMATALRENIESLENNMKHKKLLAEKLRERIFSKCPSAVFHGNNDKVLPGFVSVGFRGKNAEGIMRILDLKGIAVSTGAACDSVRTQVSHVLKAMNLEDELAKGTLRITLGRENTEEDVDGIVNALSLAGAFSAE